MTKRCIVTGASRGIGRAIAVELGRKGHEVFLVARSEADLTATATAVSEAGGKAHQHVADLTKPDAPAIAVAAAVQAMGGLDVLVNNAGMGRPGDLENVRDADFDLVFKLNVWAPMAMARAAVPHLERAAGASSQIVNIGSVVGYVGYPGGSVYAGSKWALRGMNSVWRQELYPKNVKVAYVGPGMVTTDFFQGRVDLDDIRDWALDPKDVAHGVMAVIEQGRNSDIREMRIEVLDRS